MIKKHARILGWRICRGRRRGWLWMSTWSLLYRSDWWGDEARIMEGWLLAATWVIVDVVL